MATAAILSRNSYSIIPGSRLTATRLSNNAALTLTPRCVFEAKPVSHLYPWKLHMNPDNKIKGSQSVQLDDCA